MERSAWEAGAGLAEPLDDPDLDDAIRLGMPDEAGGTWWRPSSLDDLHAVPERVLMLMDLFRAGVATARDPWSWWDARADGPYDPLATRSHLYRATWDGQHEGPARCGFRPPEGAAWARAGDQPAARCKACSGEREPEGSGTIGGIDVRTRQRVEG